MDYNKLRTFVVVGKLGGVTRAARALHRTQSAISQQLRALEEDLGVGLLQRRSGRVCLTAEGEMILAAADESLASIDRKVAAVRDASAIEEGLLRIGVVTEYVSFLA